MSSWAGRDRHYAYFSANGVDDPEDVSHSLDLKPNEIWKLGEAFEIRKLKSHRRSSNWRLNSGLSDEQPLSAHVEALMIFLEPKRNGLLNIQDRFSTQIVCVAYVYQSFGWDLEFDLLRCPAALRISFLFDFYPMGDHHEEIVALREQLNVRGT